MKVPERLRPLLGVLAAIVASVTVTIALIDGDGDGRPDRVDIGITPGAVPVPAAVAVDGADRDAEPDRALELGKPAQALYKRAAAAPESLDFGRYLRGPDPTPVAQSDGPLATPNFPGCKTRILPTNWSNRTEAPEAVALHYTAGGNLPGLADMNGLTAFASSPSAGVSWHFLIDAEGNCYYSVPLDKKAWTIAGLNSDTVNIEVVGRGTEPQYPASTAGARKLRQVVRRLARIYDWPLRVGAVESCEVTRPGIITHWQGGPCSGGHSDIKPYQLERVVAYIAQGDAKPKPVPTVQRQRCRELGRLRQAPGPMTERQKRRASVIKAGLAKHGLRCRPGKQPPNRITRR